MRRRVTRDFSNVRGWWLAGLALAAACGDGPSEDQPPTHPTADVVTTLPVVGSTYGVAISQKDAVYVTQISGHLLFRGRSNLVQFVDTVVVGETPAHVAFDPAGKFAYVTNQSTGTVSFVSVSTNREFAQVPLGHPAFNLLVSPDGKRVYATTDIGMVYAINTSSRAIVDSFSAGAVANGLAFKPDGSRLYVSSRDAGQVVVYNPASGDVIDTLVTGGMPQRMAVSADGNELYIANETLGLDFWDLNAGVRITTIPIDAYGLALSPDDAHIYVTDPLGGVLHIIDRAARAAGHPTVILQGRPRNIAFNRLGTEAIVTNEQGYVSVIH